MRGRFTDQGGLFSYIAPDKRVPADHPLRKVRELVRDVLSDLNRSLGRLYASEGRPSIPPEQLLSALLLQVFYGIRSERQLMEQLDYNLLYRWFVGLSPDDPVWDPTTFTKNRDRLQNGDVFTKFMSKLLNHPQVKPLLSDEHFSVDGTLIEAWASQKSFRPKDGSGDDDDGANFHGQKRKNDTHASTSDPDSRLYRKAAGREAKLCYMGHATMENRHGLAVAGRVTHANGTAERRASETMLKARRKAAGRRITAGEDKAYDTADHVANLRAIGVTPHVTQNQAVTKTGKTRTSAIDERTTRHQGYGMSHDGTIVIAYFEDGVVRGAAELHPPEQSPDALPEIAFSVEAPARRRGVGSFLFRQLIAEARAKGYRKLRITTGAQNVAMRALANKFGAHLTFSQGESAGTIDVIKHGQPQSASEPFGFASTLAAARAIAASNRAYWRMLFKMYGWGRAA